jgi:hypothetical protein
VYKAHTLPVHNHFPRFASNLSEKLDIALLVAFIWEMIFNAKISK